MKKTIIFSLVMLFSAGLFSQVIPQWISGDWAGKGFQPSDKGTWEIILSTDLKTKTIIVSYPGLNCSGNWKIESSTENSALLTEIIINGKTNCISGSKIFLNLVNPGCISVVWDSNVIAGPDATAIIMRQAPNLLSGKWKGTGYQYGNNTYWDAEFTYKSGQLQGEINYPSLGCVGFWILKETGTNTAIFYEKITDGTTKCVDGSLVYVYFINDKLMNVVWDSEQIYGIDASAVMEKISK